MENTHTEKARHLGSQHYESPPALEELVSQIDDGLYFTDGQGVLLYANSGLARILGYSTPEEVLGRRILDFVPTEYMGKTNEQYLAVLTPKSTIEELITKILRKDGSTAWIEVRPIRPREGSEQGGSFGIIRDISERKNSEEALRRLAVTDELTGLLNRRGFYLYAKEVLSELTGSSGRGVVLFVDMDLLKTINDSFGHGEGDASLRLVAAALSKTFRTSDIIARYGGDEFVVLAPDISDHDIANYLDSFQQDVAIRVQMAGLHYAVSATVGIYPFEAQESLTLQELIKRADSDMYRRKRFQKTVG